MKADRPGRRTGKSESPHRREPEAASADLLSPTAGSAFYVYIAGRNRDGELKTGATGNLASVAPLCVFWLERLDDIPAARALAERIELWPNIWKLQMIDRTNPDWKPIACDEGCCPPPTTKQIGNC